MKCKVDSGHDQDIQNTPRLYRKENAIFIKSKTLIMFLTAKDLNVISLEKNKVCFL